MRSVAAAALFACYAGSLSAQLLPSPRVIANTAAAWDSNAMHWARHEVTVLGLSTEGTRVVTWRTDEDSLAKVVVESLGETGKSIATYYLAEGFGLFLAVERVEWYDRPMSGHPAHARVDSLYYRRSRLLRGIRSDSTAQGTRATRLGTHRGLVLARMKATLAAAARRGVAPN